MIRGCSPNPTFVKVITHSPAEEAWHSLPTTCLCYLWLNINPKAQDESGLGISCLMIESKHKNVSMVFGIFFQKESIL